MRWISYILMLIIIYFVCSGRSCTEDEDSAIKREEQYIKDLKDSVKLVFMSDSLSGDLLRAYEVTAVEKINDLADYQKIISDTTLDIRFRQQAFKMAGNLFIPGITAIDNWWRDYPPGRLNGAGLSASQLLTRGTEYWAGPEQINVASHFLWKNDSTYKGNLSFYQKWISYSGPQQPGNASVPFKIDIYLIRSLKPFGTQKLRVWDVYLGDIY